MFITKFNRLFTKHGRVVFAVLTLFIIIPFVLYFSSGVNFMEMLTPKNSSSGVSMYGKSLTQGELNRLIDMKLVSLSFQWGLIDFRNSELRKEVLDQCLERARLLDEAGKLGIKASDKEVAEKILGIRLFQADNSFDEDKFNNYFANYLNRFGLNKADLDEAIRGDLVIDKLREQITQSVIVNEGEVKAYYLLNNEEVVAKVARFKSDDFMKAEEPDAKALTDYLAANQANYRMPARYKAELVKFDFSGSAKEAAEKCTDKMIENYYNANKSKYMESVAKPLDQVRNQIRKAIVDQRKQASDREMFADCLNTIYKNCSSGKPLPFNPQFDSMAKLTRHIKSNSNIEDFEIEAYYNSNKSKYTEQAQKPFEKAKDDAKVGLLKQEREKMSVDKAQRTAIEVYKQIEKEGFSKAQEIFNKFFKEKGMAIIPVDWIEAKATAVPGVADEPDLAKDIAKLHPDQPISNAIKGKNSAFIACLVGIEKERDAKLEEVKERLVKDYKAEKALALARDTARDVAARITKALEEKKDFKTAAGDAKFSDVPKFTVVSSPSGVPDARAIAGTAVKLKAGSASASVEVATGAFVVYVESRIIPQEADFAAKKDIQTRVFKSKKEQAAWENFTKYLKEQSKTELSKEMATDKPKPMDYDPNSMPFDF